MNKKNRDKWVRIAMQYACLEPVYNKTRKWKDLPKWAMRCAITVIVVALRFPIYYFRMNKLMKNHFVTSVYSGIPNNYVDMYLPNIRISGFSVVGDYIQMMIFTRRRLYEIDELEYIKQHIIKPDMIYVDVGANIGNHSIFFSKTCSAHKVYCFEPIPSTCNILKKNLDLNTCNNTEVYNIALAATEDYCSIKRTDPNNIGGTQLKADKSGSIPAKKLDDYPLSEINIIKIDVEGMEYEVLIGAENSIRKNKPVILIEIWPENYSRTNSLLEKYGYSLRNAFPNNNYLFQAEDMTCYSTD